MKFLVSCLLIKLFKRKPFTLMWRCLLVLLWVIKDRLFVEHVSSRCAGGLTSLSLLLNLSFLGTILETATVLASYIVLFA